MKELIMSVMFIGLASFLGIKSGNIYGLLLQVMVLIFILMWQNRTYRVKSLLRMKEIWKTEGVIEYLMKDIEKEMEKFMNYKPIVNKKKKK